MLCRIKEIEDPIENMNGEPKEILVDSFKWNMNGEHGTTYSYRMSKEKFERPIHKSYIIEIERKDNLKFENGMEEYQIGKMHYYDFVDYDIEDCIGESKIDMIATQLGVSSEKLWKVVIDEVGKLQEKIRKEFEQTKEYETHMKHEQILKEYKKAKEAFAREYGIGAAKYDYCYNVFGELMNAEYLNEIIQAHEERIKFEKENRHKHKKFSDYFNQSTFGGLSSSYSEEEQVILAKFYKVLAKKYHPDANPDVDTSSEMILINKLKKDWRI